KSLSCFSVSSLEMPYSSWILPASRSRLPAITSSWSSVSLHHCCFALPLICFQFPSMRSQFICVSFDKNEHVAGVSGPVLGSSSQAACQAHFPRGFNHLRMGGRNDFL